MSVLVLIEHDNQNIKASSLNTITAAKKIDKSVHAIVLGENCSKVAEQISKCEGIEEVFIAIKLPRESTKKLIDFLVRQKKLCLLYTSDAADE